MCLLCQCAWEVQPSPVCDFRWEMCLHRDRAELPWEAVPQHDFSFCSKPSMACAGIPQGEILSSTDGTRLRDWHSLCLSRAFALLSAKQLATRDFSWESPGSVSQYCTATLFLLPNCSVKMIATVSVVTSEQLFVAKPRSSPVSGEWDRVLPVYINFGAESQRIKSLEPAMNRKIWSPSKTLLFYHSDIIHCSFWRFFLIQKSSGLGFAGMPCGHTLFSSASEDKSETVQRE